MNIKICSYDKDNTNKKNRPLLIGCSGGGGHNAAIQGIAGYLRGVYESSNLELPLHNPVLYTEKESSRTRSLMHSTTKGMHAGVLGTALRSVVEKTAYPVLPSMEAFTAEIHNLDKTQATIRSKNGRNYVDMLLDIHPAGYESTAVWNLLQRTDRTQDLKKLIEFQPRNDLENHHLVQEYYSTLLKNAATSRCPYTEIISTQAMALPALCDAVIEYNRWLETHPSIKAPKVLIHQYMTDLPTEGAVHFFNALSRLHKKQQQQMKIYGVGMTQKTLDHFFEKAVYFEAVVDVPAHENPMVRPGFKESALDKSGHFHKETTLNLAEGKLHTVAAGEQIASIMLGSQAGLDTVNYIESLIKSGVHKVFIFGGKTPELSSEIDKIVSKHPEYAEKIVRLGNQGDKEIAALMSRSNLVIMRSGGLSVMEQLAMNHSKEQTILIHHRDTQENQELSSGISWEDANATLLLSHLTRKGIHALKTSPQRAENDIPYARLLAAIKRFRPDSNPRDVEKYLNRLSKTTLERHCEALIQSELEHPPALPNALCNYLTGREEKAKSTKNSLSTHCLEAQKRLEEIIRDEIALLGLTEQYTKQNETHNNLDIDKVVTHSKHSDFSHASPNFQQAVESYKSLQLFQLIMGDKNSTNDKKIDMFRNNLTQPKIQSSLCGCKDPVFTELIKEIMNQFSEENTLSFARKWLQKSERSSNLLFSLSPKNLT